MGDFIRAAKIDEVPLGEGKRVEVAGKTIALFNVGGSFYAIDDTCPHAGGPLSEGFLEGEVVICPWHSSGFEIKTGKVVGPPAETGVSSYLVRVEGTDIETKSRNE